MSKHRFTERDPGRPRLAVLSALVPPVALIGGWTVAAALQADFDPVHESISALAAQDTPHRWVMTLGLILTGCAHVLTASALPHQPRRSRMLLALGGVAVLGVAAVPLPARVDSSIWHTIIASISFVLLAIWPWRRGRGVPIAATVVLSGLVVVTGLATVGQWATFGLVERLAAGAQALWPLVAALLAWRGAGGPVGMGRARRLILIVPLTIGAFVGGVTATAVAPATGQTDLFRARILLSLNPAQISDLVARTTFGDVEVSFRGLAPGIEVQPSVRPEITSVISAGTTDLSALQPSPAAVDTAISEAAIALAIRFGIGALIGSLLIAGAYALLVQIIRGRRLRRAEALLPALGAAVLVSALTGVALQQTYQPQRQTTFRTTGLIGLVQSNSGLLSEVESRAGQVTPYLRNLLALSSALQQRYVPSGPERPVGAKILLVSDIHDGNAYALMRTIVQEEGIAGVIDAGDIVTFGRPDELDAAGIPAGIESLGVPYFFVKGNHDGTGPDDEGVLRRLAQVPNVVLLQPDSSSYREAKIDGVTIAGFNDPRWFGDSGTGTAALQKPTAAQFRATFEGREPLDIVVGHEPSAVRGMPLGSLLINGHMHAADLEGNRIQVGTFTGGGPFSHFLENEGGEELVGQPSAFDILTFGNDCRVQSLTRYTFRNIIEGRPAYDDISLINGSRIQGTAPADAPARECTMGNGLTVETVPAVAGDSPSAPTTTEPASTTATDTGSTTPGSTTTP